MFLQDSDEVAGEESFMTPEERALLGGDGANWQRKMELEMAIHERAKALVPSFFFYAHVI